jgi:hypothetical protein
MRATRRTAAVALLVVAFASGCRPPPPAGYLDALAVLDRIPVANEHGSGYDRNRFGYPAGGGLTSCDTRQRVLIDESLEQVLFAPAFCAFSGGRWYSAYDGVTTTKVQDLEIDHVVALKEAWDSGAFAWDDTRLVAYANDLTDGRTLLAVTTASNRQKADSDPSNWLPPLAAAQCPFVSDWLAIKARWGLTMDASEHARIRNLLLGPCSGLSIAPYGPAPTGP